jgi:hypothetical protein
LSETNNQLELANQAKQELETQASILNGNLDGSQVQFQQSKAQPTGDFVDMNTHPYAWYKAFPTVFPPRHVDNEWVILGDKTGKEQQLFRNDPPSMANWAKWLMWRSDGRAARHPILPFVLHSEIEKC